MPTLEPAKASSNKLDKLQAIGYYGIRKRGNMNKKDPFGFNQAINWDKLNDPKVLKELEELFKDEEKEDEEKD